MKQGFTRNFSPLEMLTGEQVEAIHRGTLDVLWETGVRFESERALETFEEHGCKVDFEERRVRFPPGLVEECLRRAPSSFRIKARNPENDVVVGGNTTYFPPVQGKEILDLEARRMRVATRKENYDGVKVLDALDTVHLLVCYSPYFGFEGVPPVMAIPESAAAKFRNSSKVNWCGYSNECEIFTVHMAQLLGVDILGNLDAAAPLTYFDDAVEAAFRFAEAGLPLQCVTGPVCGGTGPATIAGCTVSCNAEIIAGIVLVQLIKPGTRVLANDFATTQNMRSGAPGFGHMGTFLHSVVFNQVWRNKYHIPTIHSTTAFMASKEIDVQLGYGKGMGALIVALSGGHLVHMHGSVYGELTWSPLQAIVDDDIAGMVGRALEGVRVDNETLAIDLINEVGPIPGHYLAKAHTREWWPREQFIPKVEDRLTVPEWESTGKKGILDYARERMEDILATHKVDPALTDAQEQGIERILKDAREYYRGKGLISDEEWEAYSQQIESPNYPYE
jgi:trimethylamine--corrinoid protein Co-methyltransferase